MIEISFKEWESPPGLGICPLDVIFSVCYSISSWLNLNADHVVVSYPNVCNECSALLIKPMHSLSCIWPAKPAQQVLSHAGAAYEELLRHRDVLCAFSDSLLSDIQHGHADSGQGLGGSACPSSALSISRCPAPPAACNEQALLGMPSHHCYH